MTTFSDREKGFENKFKHDQEANFKVTARRNKLLGLWVARELGLTGDAAEAYAKSVVVADMEKPGDDDVVQKVMADMKAKGLTVTEHRIRSEMSVLATEARKQLAGS
jgi:hypothetical protein